MPRNWTGLDFGSTRWEVESGDEVLEANTEAAKGEILQPPAPTESHSESLVKPAKGVKSPAQSDGLYMDDDGLQTPDEVNMYGQDDYNDLVGYKAEHECTCR